MRYKLEFNTQAKCYEIVGIVTNPDGSDYCTQCGEYGCDAPHISTHRVVAMSPRQWNQFTYTVDGAEDTRTIHEDVQVTYDG